MSNYIVNLLITVYKKLYMCAVSDMHARHHHGINKAWEMFAKATLNIYLCLFGLVFPLNKLLRCDSCAVRDLGGLCLGCRHCRAS
jgi:hypothetical protein